MARAYGKDTSWLPPHESVSGTSSWEEDPSRPRTSWRDYISALAWESLGIPQSELADVAREREVLLKL